MANLLAEPVHVERQKGRERRINDQIAPGRLEHAVSFVIDAVLAHELFVLVAPQLGKAADGHVEALLDSSSASIH